MINTPALLIMFRIGARIVASPAKNGALDALRGTQHLLTQAGRDVLAAQYQAGYGAGAQVPRPPPPATAAAALSALAARALPHLIPHQSHLWMRAPGPWLGLSHRTPCLHFG